MADGLQMRDLLSRLDKAIAGSKTAVDGFSSFEAATAWGCGQNCARDRIRALARSGLVEFAGKRIEMSLAGVRMHTPVYRAVKAVKKRK
jgi:hypothetical protein